MPLKKLWIVAVCALAPACTGTQQAHMVLAEFAAEERVPGGTAVAGSERTDTMTLRLADRSVPLHFEWNVVRDSAGCLHPGNIRVRRSGGDDALVIDAVRVNDGSCGMGRDSIPFAPAYVVGAIRTHRGIQRHSSDGPIATLREKDEFEPHEWTVGAR
jgi:hypothetical protein